MTGSCRLLQYCRFERDEQIEYIGTKRKRVHQGKGCIHHGQAGSRIHPGRGEISFNTIALLVLTFDRMVGSKTSDVPLAEYAD